MSSRDLARPRWFLKKRWSFLMKAWAFDVFIEVEVSISVGPTSPILQGRSAKKKRYEAFSSPFLLSQRSLQQSQELSRLRSTITTPALTRSFSSNFTSSSVRQQGDLVSLRWFQDKGWTFAFSWWEFDRTLGWLIINEATMVVLVGNPLYAHLVSYGRSSSCFLRWKIDTNVYSQQWPQQSCSI